ncbi:hypothetical protein QOT17_014691 [Balamuthia mandrillaris]
MWGVSRHSSLSSPSMLVRESLNVFKRAQKEISLNNPNVSAMLSRPASSFWTNSNTRRGFATSSMTGPFSSTSPTRYDEDEQEEDFDPEAPPPELEEDEEGERVSRRRQPLTPAMQKEIAARRELVAAHMIEEYKDQHDARPLLNYRVKELIHLLHRRDPEEWTVERLSLKFGLKKTRVAAIIQFRDKELELLGSGERLSWMAQEMAEQYFGSVARLPGDKTLLEEERGSAHPSTLQPAMEDMDEEALLEHRINIRRAKHRSALQPPKEELPPQPPQPASKEEQDPRFAGAEREPTIIARPYPKHPWTGKKYTLVEADDPKPFAGRKHRLNDATRLVLVRDPNGVFRTASWKERRDITLEDKRGFPQKKYRPAEERRFFAGDQRP